MLTLDYVEKVNPDMVVTYAVGHVYGKIPLVQPSMSGHSRTMYGQKY